MIKIIILYSNGCPRCNILKSKLIEKNITYEINNDLGVLVAKGFRTVPVLQVNDDFLNYVEAINWINKQGDEN